MWLLVSPQTFVSCFSTIIIGKILAIVDFIEGLSYLAGFIADAIHNLLTALVLIHSTLRVLVFENPVHTAE